MSVDWKSNAALLPGALWDHSGTVLGPFWDRSEIVLNDLIVLFGFFAEINSD